MRELKFRAWHKKRKKFYEVIHLHRSFHEGLWVTCRGFDIIEQKDIHIQIQPNYCTIMQFTGLKDKDGREIYEGDIVQWVDTEGVVHVKEISYSDGSLWVGNMPYVHLKESGFFQTKLQIIGNIHENPELLTN